MVPQDPPRSGIFTDKCSRGALESTGPAAWQVQPRGRATLETASTLVMKHGLQAIALEAMHIHEEMAMVAKQVVYKMFLSS